MKSKKEIDKIFSENKKIIDLYKDLLHKYIEDHLNLREIVNLDKATNTFNKDFISFCNKRLFINLKTSDDLNKYLSKFSILNILDVKLMQLEILQEKFNSGILNIDEMPDLFDNNNFDLNTLFKEKEMNEDVKNRVISIQNKYLNLQKEIDNSENLVNTINNDIESGNKFNW